jgi:myosin heavy subunit
MDVEHPQLLQGAPALKKVGVLMTIDLEGRNPQPSDDKLINNLHRAFATHNNFIKPHPRDRASKFTINHYAGIVQYTVGEFLAKNSDRLPNEVTDVFSASKVPIIKELWKIHAAKAGGAAATSNGKGPRRANDSIVKKFEGQITDLITTLDATRCSFIRCVKPNW